MALCQNARPRVLALAAKGDSAACLEELTTHLRLNRAASEHGHYLIGLLVNTTADAILLEALQHVLSVVKFSEPELATLQQQLARISLDEAASALRQERVVGTHMLRHLTLELLQQLLQQRDVLPWSSAPTRIEEAAHSVLMVTFACRPEGWKLADAATYAGFFHNEIEPCVDVAAGTVLRSRVIATETAAEKLMKDAGSLSLMSEMPVGSFTSSLHRAAKHQAKVHTALLWCAIERHRLKHGRLPDTLEALTPEFLDKLPCDPVNGQPLRYVRKDERDYLLYSVGWNEKDDGGVETKKREEGDWVWSSDPRLIRNLDIEREKAMEKAREQRVARRKTKAPSVKATPK